MDSRLVLLSCLECCTTFDVDNYDKVYLSNNAFNFNGIGTIHLSLDNCQVLMLKDVRYILGIKKSLLLVRQMELLLGGHSDGALGRRHARRQLLKELAVRSGKVVSRPGAMGLVTTRGSIRDMAHELRCKFSCSASM